MKKILINPQQYPELQPHLVGGKAHHLTKLLGMGVQTSDFVIVPTHVYKHWLTHRNLPAELNNELNNLEKTLNVSQRDGPVLWAVRSSAPNEDGAHLSFAGMFETKLGVSTANLSQAIVKLFENHNKSAAPYLYSHQLEPDFRKGMPSQSKCT